jgi:hypothetical protein
MRSHVRTVRAGPSSTNSISRAKPNGKLWVCRPWPKTPRARSVRTLQNPVGRTKEEAEENARILYEPKVKGKERKPTQFW